MPLFLLTPMIGLVASFFLTWGGSRQMFGTAAILTLIVLLITMFLEVPMNDQIGSWTAGDAPADWMNVRDRWLRHHLIRTIAGIIAFVCAAIGLTRL